MSRKLLNKQLLLNFTDSGEIGIINYVAGNLLIKLTVELNTLISVESYIYKVFLWEEALFYHRYNVYFGTYS